MIGYEDRYHVRICVLNSTLPNPLSSLFQSFPPRREFTTIKIFSCGTLYLHTTSLIPSTDKSRRRPSLRDPVDIEIRVRDHRTFDLWIIIFIPNVDIIHSSLIQDGQFPR